MAPGLATGEIAWINRREGVRRQTFVDETDREKGRNFATVNIPRLAQVIETIRAGFKMDKIKYLPAARLVNRSSEILKLCQGKNVLHIGMGGYIDEDLAARSKAKEPTHLARSLHVQVSRVASRLSGLDVNSDMISAMKSNVPGNYHLADITDRNLKQQITEKFDVVLFADVIEHITCFQSALENIKHLLNPTGVCVITTVSAYDLRAYIKMIFRYESVHLEHVCYFSYMTMRRLLQMTGFHVDRFCFTYRQRNNFIGFLDRVSHFTSLISIKLFPQFASEILLVAHPIDQRR